MTRVVIGIDLHKRSVTIEVMAPDESVLGGGRYGTDEPGYAALLREAKQWPDRVWAIEGCSGIGRHVAVRPVADGEQVVDVPPKLSARARVFSTGQGRKTDATDAHSIALVGTRMAGLRPVVDDQQLAVLRVLGDRRRALGEDHNRMVAQLHHWLVELISGGAEKDLSASQAKALLAEGPAARPRRQDTATRRRRADRRPRADLRPQEGRRQGAPRAHHRHRHLATDLNGIGPSGAARLLVEVGDMKRFPTKGHFASWNGPAPLDASSGDRLRYRLSRAGDRQINRMLHIMATVQLRNPSQGRDYYDRKKAAGKSSMAAMRCLKRRLSDVVYRHMVNDAVRLMTLPGGLPEATTKSSATGSHPDTGSSNKSLPDSATTEPRTALPAAS